MAEAVAVAVRAVAGEGKALGTKLPQQPEPAPADPSVRAVNAAAEVRAAKPRRPPLCGAFPAAGPGALGADKAVAR